MRARTAMRQGPTDDFLTDVKAVVATPVAGLTAGTIVMTMAGEQPVEDLEPGDRIITRDTGMAVLRDIQKRTVRVAAVSVKAGSLGHTRPQDDMILGPDTLVHIRDWRAKALFGADVATVKAKRLLDGEFVAELDPAEVEIYELMFDRQHIIYANGLEVASSTT